MCGFVPAAGVPPARNLGGVDGQVGLIPSRSAKTIRHACLLGLDIEAPRAQRHPFLWFAARLRLASSALHCSSIASSRISQTSPMSRISIFLPRRPAVEAVLVRHGADRDAEALLRPANIGDLLPQVEIFPVGRPTVSIRALASTSNRRVIASNFGARIRSSSIGHFRRDAWMAPQAAA
jgi:hypothetical protein